MGRFAGLDLGTSNIKAVVLGEDGGPLGRAEQPTPWMGTELDPGRLRATALGTLRRALGDVEEAIAALGVTGFAESGVSIDAAGEPCAPIVAWHDSRGARAEAELLDQFGAEGFAAASGQRVDRRLTVLKQREMHRDGFDAQRRWMAVPEWMVQALGGAPGPELSLWSRTGFLRIGEPAIFAEAADWAGLPWREQPEPVPAGEPAGTASGGSGEEWLSGAVLTVAGHDHLCAALGADAVGDEVIFDSWGNGEALLRSAEEPPAPAEIVAGFNTSWHVLAGRRTAVRGTRSGLLLKHVLAQLGRKDSSPEFDERALQVVLDRRREIRFEESGTILARPPGLDEAAVWRAAIELAFSRVRDAIAGLERLGGPVSRVVGSGGWLHSPAMLQMKEQAVGGFERSEVEEPGALGAALLAGCAARAWTLEEGIAITRATRGMTS